MAAAGKRAGGVGPGGGGVHFVFMFSSCSVHYLRAYAEHPRVHQCSVQFMFMFSSVRKKVNTQPCGHRVTQLRKSHFSLRVSVSQLYSLRVGTEVGYCEVRSGLLTLCGLRNNAHSTIRTKSNFICNPRRYMDGLIGKVGSFATLRAPFLAAAELASLQ